MNNTNCSISSYELYEALRIGEIDNSTNLLDTGDAASIEYSLSNEMNSTMSRDFFLNDGLIAVNTSFAMSDY